MKKKRLSALAAWIAAGITILLVAGYIWLMWWAFTAAPPAGPPVLLLVILTLILAAIIIGVAAALVQRLRELKKGELDDAEKY